uniref:WD_REPEATS_REGION domain-containing protein n=1 Tax=Meloidogyne hapla TaxID=6305 RepID=A0A1I8C1V8_MELHA
MASINLSENLLIICSSHQINLFKCQTSLFDYSLFSSYDVSTIEDTLKVNRKNKTDKNNILCSSISNNAKYLAVGTSSKLLLIFELNKNELNKELPKPFFCELIKAPTRLLDFCISPNGKFVLTADRDEKSFGHTSFVKSIACIDDNKLISGGGDSIIYLWDLNSFKCISTSTKVSETAIRKVGIVEIYEVFISLIFSQNF